MYLGSIPALSELVVAIKKITKSEFDCVSAARVAQERALFICTHVKTFLRTSTLT